MAKNTESGNAVNIANYKKLADTCTGYEAKYNPGNTDLTVANMLLLWALCRDANNTVSTALQGAKNPINDRQILFSPLRKLVTRVQSILESSGANNLIIADAKTLADKIRGYKKPKNKTNPDGTPSEDTVSQSQQSYVQLAQHFGDYIALIKTVTKYSPNEDELKTTVLDSLKVDLDKANDGIATILQPFNQAKITRDESMYGEGGMVDLALKCKKYVKGVFGASSAQYKLVSGIKFKRPKKKKKK